jgi:hypothetical protein
MNIPKVRLSPTLIKQTDFQDDSFVVYKDPDTSPVKINPISESELWSDAIAYSSLSSTNNKAVLTCAQWLQDFSARLRLKNDVIRKKGLSFVDYSK